MLKENYQVSKSKGLLAITKSGLSLSEYKLLDIYLSKINPMAIREVEEKTVEKMKELDKITDEKMRKDFSLSLLKERDEFIRKCATVEFSKEEYCEILGINSKVRIAQIQKHLEHFAEGKFTITDDKEVIVIPLFSETSYSDEDEIIKMICNYASPVIKEMFFDIKGYQYIKYRLRYVVNLKSVYSYKMYLYLLNHHLPSEWSIDVATLKKDILECVEKSYSEYKRFNDLVLKKVKKEINEKTNITFSYTPKRVKKKVVRIEISCYFKNQENIITGDYREHYTSEKITDDLLHAFDSEWKRLMSVDEIEKIERLCCKYDERRVICALNEAVVYNKIDLNYIEKVLESWTEKHLSVEDLEAGKR